MEEGKQVLENLPPGREKDKLERKLKELEKNWNELAERIDGRKEISEEIEPSTEQYYNTCQDFTGWLDDAEKRLKDTEKLPCDAETLQQTYDMLEV